MPADDSAAIEFRLDDLRGAQSQALLRAHLASALKELDARRAEVKSMRTVAAHLRKGVAAAMLQHLLDEARRRGYRRLSLETGSMAAFAPAPQLYARFGFAPCPPFADYAEDPYSVFMSRALEPT